MRLFIVSLAGIGLGGCFSPNYGQTGFACGDDGLCPSGYTCGADNFCHSHPFKLADADPNQPDSSTVVIRPDADPNAPDAMPVADAAPNSPDAGQAPPCLVLDENFDDALNLPWVQESGTFKIITSDTELPFFADTRPKLAWFGGYSDALDILGQQLAVPAGTGPLTLKLKVRIQTTETGTTAKDLLTVELQDSMGATQEVLCQGTSPCTSTFSNLDVTGAAWVEKTLTSQGTYNGQTIRLVFISTQDTPKISNFLVDTICFE
jgi:hypothetical protein